MVQFLRWKRVTNLFTFSKYLDWLKRELLYSPRLGDTKLEFKRSSVSLCDFNFMVSSIFNSYSSRTRRI